MLKFAARWTNATTLPSPPNSFPFITPKET